MALNRLNGNLSGYNAYNIPPANERNTQLTTGSELLEGQTRHEEPKQPKQRMDLTVEVSKRDNASIENVAISLGVLDGVSIDLFGGNGLASDDMKQAISGMKRDHILHEYQYFVGTKDMAGKNSKVIYGSEDGLVMKL